jgi:hypothetical protein
MKARFSSMEQSSEVSHGSLQLKNVSCAHSSRDWGGLNDLSDMISSNSGLPGYGV